MQEGLKLINLACITLELLEIGFIQVSLYASQFLIYQLIYNNSGRLFQKSCNSCKKSSAVSKKAAAPMQIHHYLHYCCTPRKGKEQQNTKHSHPPSMRKLNPSTPKSMELP